MKKLNIQLLFDYQQYEHNKNLDEIIKGVQKDEYFLIGDESLAIITGGKTQEKDQNQEKPNNH